jgi:hypothetical protein
LAGAGFFAGAAVLTGALIGAFEGALDAALAGPLAGALPFDWDFGAGLAGAFFAGTVFLAGAGFLAGLAAGLTPLRGGFLAGAFLAAGAALTGFPEGFRDGEGLDVFFNGSRVKPKSRARKDR